MAQHKRTTSDISLWIFVHVKYLDWNFVVRDDDNGRPYLQIQFMAPDSDYLPSKESMAIQKCRKWFLSPYMTNTELVRTCYKAILAAVEHEVGEKFKYDGEAIFSPHTDIEHLWMIRAGHGVRKDLDPDDVRK
jgi:hypothetical protein